MNSVSQIVQFKVHRVSGYKVLLLMAIALASTVHAQERAESVFDEVPFRFFDYQFELATSALRTRFSWFH